MYGISEKMAVFLLIDFVINVNNINNRKRYTMKFSPTDICESRYYCNSFHECINNWCARLTDRTSIEAKLKTILRITYSTLPCRQAHLSTIKIICHSESCRLVLTMLRLKYLRLGNRSSNGICFNSFFLSHYLRREK